MNVAIIPARSGSKHIFRKDIREFHGKPVIAYSIEVARASGLFDRVIVSTEDDEIAEVAKTYGAEVLMRDPALAEVGAPDCGTQEVTRDALVKLAISDGYACCLYPCAPMLCAEDLQVALKRLKHSRNFIYVSGWYYFGEVWWFLRRDLLGRGSRGPGIRWIDINTLDDWREAERRYAGMLSCA